MIVLYLITSSIVGVGFFYTADYFLTKWERKKFREIISRDTKTTHEEHSTK